MKLRRIEVAPFRIPYRRPVVIGGVAVAARIGLLVQGHGDDGLVGLGEVAPHPTAGDETLHDATRAIAKIQEALLTVGPIEIDFPLPDRLEIVPSAAARAGLEMACWDLAAQSAGVPVSQMLGAMVTERIPVNAIVDQQEPSAAATAARELVAEGFRCLKLKVSHDLVGDAARVAAVRAATGPEINIRLDANGIWTVDEATAAISRLAVHGLEYVEQPVRKMADLAHVRRVVETPIAADESVTDADSVRRLAAMEAADIVVVKPALLGLSNAAAVVRAARACGLNVVVTSVLDTSIGIAAALHLAATLPRPVLPCGLATASLLVGDLVRQPLVPYGGWLSVPQGPGLGIQLDAAAVRRWCCDSAHAE
ncbi:MAG: o-succinylbenzoate synthase [Candidatus Binatia bacterium]